MIQSAVSNDFDKCSVLALDDNARKVCDELGISRVISVADLLQDEPRLPEALIGRTEIEKIFSMGPQFLKNEINSLEPDEWLVYCDADLLFFESLEHYLSEIEEANVVITPHRHYLWNRSRLAKFGAYNVGLVAFRNNDDGRRILNYWADACMEWCRDVPEDGRYADQKYLENFPYLSESVFIDHRQGVNLAPWNSMGRKISFDENNYPLIDGDRLHFFHVQGIRRFASGWSLGHIRYLSLASEKLKQLVYVPYLAALEQINGTLRLGEPASARTLGGSWSGLMSYLEIFSAKLLRQWISLRTLDRLTYRDPYK